MPGQGVPGQGMPGLGGAPGPGRVGMVLGGAWFRGVWSQGLPGPGGGVGAWSWGGCLVPGGLVLEGGFSRGYMVETHPPDGYCCGQYASYWNAFLF